MKKFIQNITVVLAVLATLIFTTPIILWGGAWFLLLLLAVIVVFLPTVVYLILVYNTPLSDLDYETISILGFVGSIVYVCWKWVYIVAPFLIEVEKYIDTHNWHKFFWGL